MYKVRGFLAGKFAPLHNGHIEFIYRAAAQVDELIVILSHDPKWINEQPYPEKLDWRIRMRWLLDTFKDNSNIHIHLLDETNIPEFPNGWNEWSKLSHGIIDKYDNVDFVFSSEPSYSEMFSKYFPKCEHIIIDSGRSMVNITATQIRQDMLNNWQYIPSTVRKDFVKKVCIVGGESTGKTTLTRYLAKVFSTSWVEEYGRDYVQEYCHGNENLLVSSDFDRIAFGHKQKEYEASLSANKVMFIDTNTATTKFYHDLYCNESNTVLDTLSSKEDYDLYIVLKSNVPWVDDGMRQQSFDRENKEKVLIDNYLLSNGINKSKLVYIDDSEYLMRMVKAVAMVKNLLGE